ncbi:MAG: T9SS type A sorting domain-containing protein [Bacteroidota bacterium]
MKKLLLITLIGLSGNCIAQNFHLLNVPVFENGEQLANPWTGGMNAPQWSAIDLNGNGKKDLFAFDRNGHVHLAFIDQTNEAGEMDYKYSRYWTDHFPRGQHYVLMRDYNRDGAADMFVSAFDEGLSGFKVYKGAFNQNNQLVFDRINFPDYIYDIIPFEIDGEVVGPVEVFNNPDYPAVDDIDGDGDLDILTLNSSGSKVLYFKNIALESGYNDEVLKYELADDCWGDFVITPFSQSLTLSSDMSLCALFDNPDPDDVESRVHGGATLCTFDNDNDGDKELLYGDLIFPNIIYAQNGGDKNNAWINVQDTTYPSNNLPVDIINFPASYHLDINNDGARDFLFSPNLSQGAPDVETAWYYENLGTDLNPEANFVKSNFLSDGMIDFGTGTFPVFVDVNADGLLDIVAGNREIWDSTSLTSSSLILLLNNGTAAEPSYEIVDRDWLEMSQFNMVSRSFSPAFGDLDGDGDEDLLIGDRQGFVHYFENIAGADQPMQFASLVPQWQEINVGSYAAPFIFDVNKDGLQDLIIGERSGNINYLPNLGTAESPEFFSNENEQPNNPFFGSISTILPGSAVGFSQPFVLEFNETMYLFSGTDAGWIVQYEINQDSLDSGSFDLITNRFGELREGFICRIGFGNVNEDGFIDAIVGNDRGGLTLFQSPLTVDGLVNDKEVIAEQNIELNIFPNPAGDYLIVNHRLDKKSFEFNIYNLLGQRLQHGITDAGSKINLSALQRSTYIIEINLDGKIFSEKFIKL